MLLGHKKEWNISHAININEPWKHYAALVKPHTKGHISYDSLSMKCVK